MASHELLSELDRDVLEGRERGLFDDALGQSLIQIYEAGVVDERIGQMIHHRIHHVRRQEALSGTPFRIPQLHEGDSVLGWDLPGKPLRIFRQYRNAHSLSAGGSGSGKTTKSLFDALQLLPHLRGSWLVDLRKQEFRVLGRRLAPLGVALDIVPARRMKLNPLQIPRGVHPLAWSSNVAEMLVDVLVLPPRASKLIQTTVHRLYHARGVLQGGRGFPTLFELREAIAGDAQANVPAKQALVDSLDAILCSLGPVLAYREGWASDELARRHIVFEFGGIQESAKNLLLNALVLPEFTSRVTRGVSNPGMNLLIMCDEAQRLCATTQTSGAPGAVGDLIGLIRGTGIALDLTLQSSSGISPAILSNTACKFIGRCGSFEDYRAIGSSMGLTAEQIQWCQFHLCPGMFVGQLGEGNWRWPFVFRVPAFQHPPLASTRSGEPGVSSDAEAAVETDALWSLPTVPAPEFMEWSREGQAGVINGVKVPSPGGGLSEAERRFLRAVIDHPGRPSSHYATIAGLGSRKALLVRERLVEEGFLRAHTVSTGKRGRESIVLEPLPSAYEAFEPK